MLSDQYMPACPWTLTPSAKSISKEELSIACGSPTKQLGQETGPRPRVIFVERIGKRGQEGPGDAVGVYKLFTGEMLARSGGGRMVRGEGKRTTGLGLEGMEDKDIPR